jgi:hypothetical protein
VYPDRVGLVGAEMAVPGWAVIALTAVPSLETKLKVTPAIDELEEVTKLVVGFELELEGEDVPEEAPAPGWKVANTIPIRMSNNNIIAAGFLYFFIEIFLFCLIIRCYHAKVHYERYIFIILLVFLTIKQ